MGLEDLNGALIKIPVAWTGGPYVCSAILASTDDVSAVTAKRRTNLATGIVIPAEFGLQSPVPEVIEPDAGVVAGDEELYRAVGVIWRLGNRIDASNLAALGIPSAC